MALSNQATITLAVNVQNMAGLRSLTTGLMSLRNQILAIQRNTVIRSGTGLAQTPAQQARAAAAATRANTQLSKAQSAALLQTARNAGTLTAAQKKLAGQQTATNKTTKQQGAAMLSLQDRIKTAEESVDSLWRASFRLTMLGSQFTQWGQSIIGQVSGVVNEFADFEFMSLRASSSLGVFEGSADNGTATVRALQDVIMDTSRELKLMPLDDVAKSVYFWGSTTGQTVNSQQDLVDVMGQVTPIIKNAEMTQTDYETAIKGTYSILAQYYPKVVETAKATQDYGQMTRITTQISEGLFYATQKTALEFEDLIQSFKMVGPVAAGVGASFEDIVTLLGDLGDLGIRGSQAGRALRQMFLQMARPSVIARQSMDALIGSFKQGTEEFSKFHGKSFIDVMFPQGRFVGTEQFLKNMYDLTKDLNVQQRIAILGRFSTANLLPAMIALVAKEGRAIADEGTAAERAAKQHQEWADAFNKSWTALSTSTKGVIEGLNRSLEVLRVTIGREFAAAAKPFIEAIGGIVDNISDWVDKNPELVQTFGRVVASIGGGLAVIGALFTAMGSIIGVFAGVKLAILAFGPLFAKWTVYGAIIGGVVDAIIRNFDMVRDRLQIAQKNIQDALNNVQGYFGDTGTTMDGLGESLRHVFDTIVDLGTNAIVVVSQVIKAISGFKPIFDFIKAIGIPVMTNFVSLFVGAKILGSISNMLHLTGALTGLGGILKGLRGSSNVMDLGGLNNLFQMGSPTNVGRFAKGMAGAKNALKGLGSSLKDFASNHFDLILMAVIAVGFAAYENNWLHFRDLVDSLTNSFRDLDAEINTVFQDQMFSDSVIAQVEGMGSELGIGFQDKFRQALQENGGLLGGLTASGMDMGKMLTGIDIPDLAVRISVEDNGALDWFQQATAKADSAKEAVANVDSELRKANLDAVAFWKGWQIGTQDLGLTADQAAKFGEAIATTLQDGTEHAGELAYNLNKLGGDDSWLNSLTDQQRKLLGIMTSVETATQASVDNATAQAQALLDNLAGLDPTNVSIANMDLGNQWIQQMEDLMTSVSPEMQTTLTKAIEEWVKNSAAAGFSQIGSPEVHDALVQSLADMGKTHIDSDTFNSLLDSVGQSIDDAAANGIPLDENGISTAISKALTDFKIETVTDTVYAKLVSLKEGLAGAVHSVFKPDSFGKMLKDAISDKKGIANFMDAFNDPKLKKALSGALGSDAQAMAVDYMSNLQTQFSTAFPGFISSTQDAFKTNFENIFNPSTLASMSPDMQAIGSNMLVSMYQALGQPIPPWLFDVFKANGGILADNVVTGFDNASNETTLNPPELAPIPTNAIASLMQLAQNALDGMPSLTLPGAVLPAGLSSQAGKNIKGMDAADANRAGSSSNPYTALYQSAMSFFGQAAPVTLPATAGPDTTASSNAISTLVSTGEQALTTMNTQVPAIKAPDISAVPPQLNTLAKGINTAFSVMATMATTWGHHLVANYAKGIEQGRGWVAQAANDIAQEAAARLHFTRPDKGPLRDLHIWGAHLVQIYAKAIRSQNPKVRAAAQNIAATIARELGKAGKNAIGAAKKAGDAAIKIVDYANKHARNALGNAHKANKDIVKDLNDTTKKIIDSVKGAHTFKNYDDYLSYLSKVHSQIKHQRDKIKHDRSKNRDLVIDKGNNDNKVTYESKKKQVIEIHLIAESPDGTVHKIELNALRKGMMEALALSDLEHVVTVP